MEAHPLLLIGYIQIARSLTGSYTATLNHQPAAYLSHTSVQFSLKVIKTKNNKNYFSLFSHLIKKTVFL